MKKVPYLLIVFRFLLAPIILALGFIKPEYANQTIAWLVFLGQTSDLFDGIIARKYGVATKTLRRLDSAVDTIFWLAIFIAAYLVFPSIYTENAFLWIAIIALELICYLTSILKFKKEPSTHAWSAKLFGVFLVLGFFRLFYFGLADGFITTTLIIGVFSQLESLTITLILRNWTHDIPTWWHAVQIRNGKEIKRFRLLN